MAEKQTPGLRVIPTVDGEGIIRCECGARMDLSAYTSFPRRDRWIFYRCKADADHVSAALPKT